MESEEQPQESGGTQRDQIIQIKPLGSESKLSDAEAEVVEKFAGDFAGMTEGTVLPPKPHVVSTERPPLQTPRPVMTSSGTAPRASTEADPPRIGDVTKLRRESKVDCLNVNKYADVLTNVFLLTPDEEALSLGVFSAWGRGKTFLMKRVKERLEAIRERPYQVILFSAWKYRSPVETWSYLYETMRKQAEDDSYLLAARIWLVKHGLAPINAMVSILALMLWSFMHGPQVVLTLLALAGAGGIAVLSKFALDARSVAGEIRKRYVALPKHEDKLGLQACLGADLRNLLIAWIPRRYFLDSVSSKNASRFAVYIVLCLLVAYQIRNVEVSSTLEATAPILATRLARFTSRSFVEPLYYAWILLFAVGPTSVILCPRIASVVLRKKASQRILLVIDDLDRCPPSQMLDIVESVTLLLDDPEVNRRVQLAVLVDETMLRQSIVEKYKISIELQNSDQKEYEIHRLTRETLEKLFLVHLRLPQLVETEVKELMDSYMAELDIGQQTTRSGNGISILRRSTPSNLSEHSIDSLTISEDEKQAFLKAIPRMMIDGDGKPRFWGPRAIRAVIARYQLARLLLRSTGKTVVPADLLDALLHVKSETALSSNATPLERIAWQVA